jgi:hypothetical protein
MSVYCNDLQLELDEEYELWQREQDAAIVAMEEFLQEQEQEEIELSARAAEWLEDQGVVDLPAPSAAILPHHPDEIDLLESRLNWQNNTEESDDAEYYAYQEEEYERQKKEYKKECEEEEREQAFLDSVIAHGDYM